MHSSDDDSLCFITPMGWALLEHSDLSGMIWSVFNYEVITSLESVCK